MDIVFLLAGLAMATDAPPAWIVVGLAQLILMSSLLWLASETEPVRRRLGYWGAFTFGLGARRGEYPPTTRLRRSASVVAGCFAVAVVAFAVTVPGSTA